MKKKQGQRADAQENVQGYREGSDAKVLLHNLNLDVRRNKALYSGFCRNDSSSFAVWEREENTSMMGCCDDWNPIVRLMRTAEDGL